MLLALRLSKAGYGSIDYILNEMPVAQALLAIEYENYASEYEAEFIAINQKAEEL